MDNKAALRQLLRWKRSRLEPASVGLRPRTGRGRRAPGLSQAQVAQLLYVSERTYAQLERGEMPSPAAGFLDRVCEVLRLEEDERTALYVYALGHEPPRPRDPLAGQDIHGAWHEAVASVARPCYVNDVAWNVLACNEAFTATFPRAPGARPALPERNLMRYMLLRESAREHHLLDWERQWARPLAAQLRKAVALYPGNADLRELDKEVEADPVAGPLYRSDPVTYVQPGGATRPVRFPWPAPPGPPERAERCCPDHLPSRAGLVTMCAAVPLGSPGARFFILVFEPAPAAGGTRP
ncbi:MULTISPECIES: helix-turn-helix domain-containing protein [Streptomyces]|uniref:Transcriptional regulator n=1 Tax=Streptomyces venezuelae TaxID=54571 RepID=A0A5P2CBK3_STRVZ|nr:helix-turn-helix domain-containing protein [Streptomyces venezuelae]QES39650.1 transcriptional regulator [Streptomyces venezuelae]